MGFAWLFSFMLAVAVIGLQIPATAVSADVVSRQDTAVTAAVDYGSDEIYNHFSVQERNAILANVMAYSKYYPNKIIEVVVK